MKIFIVSGPAGAGKTTLLNILFKDKDIKKRFIKAISYTTRKIREREKNKRDYYFVDKKEFLKLKRKNFFLESQKVLDNYYGTPKCFYNQAKEEDKNLILCIDVKGAMYLKKNLKNDKIITIFVLAEDKDELCNRLKKRFEEEDTIKKKLNLAKKELKFSKYYDYIITNKNLKDTLKIFKKILLKDYE